MTIFKYEIRSDRINDFFQFATFFNPRQGEVSLTYIIDPIFSHTRYKRL